MKKVKVIKYSLHRISMFLEWGLSWYYGSRYNKFRLIELFQKILPSRFTDEGIKFFDSISKDYYEFVNWCLWILEHRDMINWTNLVAKFVKDIDIEIPQDVSEPKIIEIEIDNSLKIEVPEIDRERPKQIINL